MQIKDTLKNNKSTIIVVLLLLLLPIGSYLLGKHNAPVKTVIQEKLHVETVEKQVVVTETKTEVKVVYVKDTAKDAHIETTTEKLANGTVVVKKVEDDHIKTEIKDNVNTNTVANKTSTDTKSQIIDESKTITTIKGSSSEWSLALMPGFDFAGALGKPTYNLIPNISGLNHLVLGASIERKILGPIYMGAWASSQGTGGLVIRINF